MDSMMGFLVTLGVISATAGDPEAPRQEPVAVEMAAPVDAASLEERRRRIELTNDWLRAQRRVEPPAHTDGASYRPGDSQPRLTVAAGR